MNHKITSPRRSVLFMPGDSRRKIEKASQLPVDTLVLDFEDGVAHHRKAEARQVTAEALNHLDFGSREILIRLSPPDEKCAIAATLAAKPHGYMLPKAESGEQVKTISCLLDEAEAEQGLESSSTGLVVVIETALGVMNLKEIATASPRLNGLLFGAEDLAGSIGAIRSKASWEVFYARSAVVTAAAAYNLDAIDQVFFDLQDLDGFMAECEFGRQLGYTGKGLIHPRQVEPANAAFSPSPEEIAQAERLLHAFEEHQAAGTGAFAFEGKMVDRPVIMTAEKILAKRQRSEK